MSGALVDFNPKSKVSLVIRKPQKEKTIVCITNIVNDKSTNIHIVLTMNDLSSVIELFGRTQTVIGHKQTIIFNNNNKTIGRCHHAKNVDDVFELLDKGSIKVIVCCVNDDTTRDAVPRLFKTALARVNFNTKFTIHINEANSYIIPEHIPYIRVLNEMSNISNIIGYCDTSLGFWNVISVDPLFQKINIRDVEKEMAIIRSPDYFKTSPRNFNIYDDLLWDELIENAEFIYDPVYYKMGHRDSSQGEEWQGEAWSFMLGCEFDVGFKDLLGLSLIDAILPTLSVVNDVFERRFNPAFVPNEKHYQSIDLILNDYPTTNIIVMFSYGFDIYRWIPSDNTPHHVSDAEIIWVFPGEGYYFVPSL